MRAPTTASWQECTSRVHLLVPQLQDGRTGSNWSSASRGAALPPGQHSFAQANLQSLPPAPNAACAQTGAPLLLTQQRERCEPRAHLDSAGTVSVPAQRLQGASVQGVLLPCVPASTTSVRSPPCQLSRPTAARSPPRARVLQPGRGRCVPQGACARPWLRGGSGAGRRRAARGTYGAP